MVNIKVNYLDFSPYVFKRYWYLKIINFCISVFKHQFLFSAFLWFLPLDGIWNFLKIFCRIFVKNFCTTHFIPRNRNYSHLQSSKMLSNFVGFTYFIQLICFNIKKFVLFYFATYAEHLNIILILKSGSIEIDILYQLTSNFPGIKRSYFFFFPENCCTATETSSSRHRRFGASPILIFFIFDSSMDPT